MKKNLKKVLLLSTSALLSSTFANINFFNLSSISISVNAQSMDKSFEDFKNEIVTANMFVSKVWDEIPNDYWQTKYTSWSNGEISTNEVINGTFADFPEVYTPQVEGYKNNLTYRYGILREEVDSIHFTSLLLYVQMSAWENDGKVDLEYVASMFPSYNPEALYGPKDDTLPDKIEPMTREQAEVAAKGYFEAEFRRVLLMEGVTNEMLLRAPADAVYKAAVAYNMTYATGGDPGVTLNFFKQMYPEVFTEGAKPISEEERQAKVDKLVENKKRLSDFATQNKENADKKQLEVGEIFELENGKYEVSSIFLLQPKEAGNQSEDKKMLSIRYEYTNTTEEVNLNDVASEIQSLTSLIQTSEGASVSLPEATYKFKDEEETETVEEVVMVKPGETVTGGLYFEVDNHEDKLQLLVIKGDSIESFDIDGNELFKLPLASASYVSTDSEPMVYILDFDKVYLIYPNQADTTQWDSMEHVSKEIQVDQLSKEAKAQYELLSSKNDLSNTVLVELNHLSYKVNGDTIEAYLKENESIVLEFTTPDNWGQLVDGNKNKFDLLN